MKKILCLLLVLCMVFGLSVNVWAEGEETLTFYFRNKGIKTGANGVESTTYFLADDDHGMVTPEKLQIGFVDNLWNTVGSIEMVALDDDKEFWKAEIPSSYADGENIMMRIQNPTSDLMISTGYFLVPNEDNLILDLYGWNPATDEYEDRLYAYSETYESVGPNAVLPEYHHIVGDKFNAQYNNGTLTCKYCGQVNQAKAEISVYHQYFFGEKPAVTLGKVLNFKTIVEHKNTDYSLLVLNGTQVFDSDMEYDMITNIGIITDSTIAAKMIFNGLYKVKMWNQVVNFPGVLSNVSCDSQTIYAVLGNEESIKVNWVGGNEEDLEIQLWEKNLQRSTTEDDILGVFGLSAVDTITLSQYNLWKHDLYQSNVALFSFTVPAGYNLSLEGGNITLEKVQNDDVNDEEDKNDAPVVDDSNNNDDDDEEPTYRTSIEKTENGSVSVNTKNPVKAEKVTITAKPDKGYEVESVIVTDKNGNEVKVTDNGNGTYSFRQPSSKVTIKVNFVKEAAKVEAPVKANPETGAPNHYFACR